MNEAIKKFVIDQAVDEEFLHDWYQNSISNTDEPVWTDEHIEEICGDFYLIPKETVKKLG